MTDNRSRKVLSRAVSRGLIDREQATSAYNELQKRRGEGEALTAEGLLVQRGLIDESQRAGLLQPSAAAADSGGAARAKQIADYEVIRELGSGAMGTVYLARQKRMDRQVALKVLANQYAREEQYIQRFLREAKACGKLRHENVVAGIDVGQWKGTYYFAQEYIDGTSVEELIEARGSLDEASSLRIALKIARALEHIGSHDLVHRDIKPENLMLTSEGVVKLCDFGLAKDHNANTALTAAGTSVGTPHYIAPEQAQGHDSVDIKADVYSLGVSLYHMLAGEPPFDEGTPYEIMVAHIDKAFPPLRRFCSVRPETRKLLDRMCAKQPAKRPTPAELVAALEDLVDDGPVVADLVGKGAPPPSSAREGGPRPRRERAAPPPKSGSLWLGVAAAVLLLGANLWFFVIRGGSPDTPAGGSTGVVDLAGSGSGSQTAPGSGSQAVGSGSQTDPGVGSGSPAIPEDELAYQRLLEETRIFLDTAARMAKAIERFDVLATRYPTRAGGRKAKQRAQELRAEADRKARQQYGSFSRRAETLAGEGKSYTALQLLRQIPIDTLQHCAFAHEIRRRSKAISDAMTARHAADLRAIGALSGKGDKASLEEALARLAAIRQYGTPEMTDDASARARQLRTRLKALGAQATAAALAAYEKAFAARVLEHWRKPALDKATAALDALASDPALAGAAARIAADKQRTRRLKELRALTLVAIGGAVGKPIRIPRRKNARIKGADPTSGEIRIDFDLGGRRVTSVATLRNLETVELVRWLAEKIDPASAAGQLDLALLAYARGDILRAAGHAEQARRGGADPAELGERIDAARRSDPESKAAVAYQALIQAIAAAKPRDAIVRIETYRKAHGGSAFARSKAGELDAKIAELRKAIKDAEEAEDKPGTRTEYPPPKLEVGSRADKAGRYELTYRLRTKRELADWIYDPQSWTHDRKFGFKGSFKRKLVWKPQIVEDFELEIDFKTPRGARNVMVEFDTVGGGPTYRIVLKVSSADLDWIEHKDHHVLLRAIGEENEKLDRAVFPERISGNSAHTLRITRQGNRWWVYLDKKALLTARDGRSQPVQLSISHFTPPGAKKPFVFGLDRVYYKGRLSGAKADK